jgi:uncharacterized protein (DUF2147 family)
MKSSLIVLLALLLTATAGFAAGDDILGVWYNQEKDAKIQIFQCGQKYCGKIVWLKQPTYPPGSKEGTPGAPKVDHNNPNPALRNRPVMGLQVLRDMQFAGDSQWKGGQVYDPKNGKTYSAKMTLVSPSRLDLRGFVGISLFGRTAKWTRAE